MVDEQVDNSDERNFAFYMNNYETLYIFEETDFKYSDVVSGGERPP